MLSMVMSIVAISAVAILAVVVLFRSDGNTIDEFRSLASVLPGAVIEEATLHKFLP